MSGKYRYIKDFEKEIIESLNQGHTLRETGINLDSHIKKCEISKPGTIKTNANL